MARALALLRGKRAHMPVRKHDNLRLSPHDPVRPVRTTQVATSYYLEENNAEAARVAKQVTRFFSNPPFAYRWLAAALGQLGRVEEASFALQTLKSKWPNSFEMYVAKPPRAYCSAEYKPVLQGLRKRAGEIELGDAALFRAGVP